MLLRPATLDDIPALDSLIRASVLTLQAADYSPAQLEASHGTVFGVDLQLIHDATYFVIEQDGKLVACGGWSRRRTLCGASGIQHHGCGNPAQRDDALLDPATEAAKIRAFFIHPAYARRGLATRILNHCEAEAAAAGFTRLELGSTLTGIPLYRKHGYADAEHLSVPLRDGLSLPVVRMVKELPVAPH
jgi:GNAT superfamily N-acetyltransferase